jgi:predicted permease
LQLFLEILTGITLPILTLVAIGYYVQKRFAFDVPTLTRMQVYVLLPAALLYIPTAARLPLGSAWPILWFTLLHFVFLFTIGWGAARALGMKGSVVTLTAFGALFSNSANFGLPLIELTFSEDHLLYQAVILSLHSVLITPFAILAFRRTGEGQPGLLAMLLSFPLLPGAAGLGFLLKGLEVTLPLPLSLPLKLLSDAFTPMALLLLGVQLAAFGTEVERRPLGLHLVLRLFLAPASAWLFAYLFRFPPDLIAFFVISASVPAGILVAIFASEYNTRPELASMMVFTSTIVSALTVTLWVYAVRYAGLH